VTKLLDGFGIPYIEGGWPGSNPKDMEYFKTMRANPPRRAKIVAFGSTRRIGVKTEEDLNLKALLAAGTSVVTLVGKSSALHVTHVLETDLEENLSMIKDSISYLKQAGKEVIYDAEHFFDGYKLDPMYALKTLNAACEAGADWLVLCDTNGGSLPDYVSEVVSNVTKNFRCRVGIHAHNDGELAVANSIAAVRAGAAQVQGTINGYGERCGNANLVSVIPTLQLKLDYRCVPADNLNRLTEISRTVSEIANLNPEACAPYVGSSAFAHKGGLHVAAVEKLTTSYEHVDPALVGNSRQIVVSELSGRGNIRMFASQSGVKVEGNEQALLKQVKDMEGQGYQFENAEGTVELMMRRSQPEYIAPFELVDVMVVVSDRLKNNEVSAEAVVKIKVGKQIFHTAAEGRGPVNALDKALRNALVSSYPKINDVRLADYKVRILDPDQATDATTRVTIEATCGDETWCTVGCSPNIIEASYKALAESLELYLLRQAEALRDLKLVDGPACAVPDVTAG
jgi:2-isopropylmalate synthase